MGQRQKGVVRCKNKPTTEERGREHGLKYQTTKKLDGVLKRREGRMEEKEKMGLRQ